MKAYKFDFTHENKQIINLPDDLMIIRSSTLLTNTETSLCHSETLQKWYVLVNMSESDLKNDIYQYLFCDGEWIDCILSVDPFPNWLDAPFKFGEMIPSLINKGFSYLPIWQRIPTGEYDEEDREIYKDDYKILCVYHSMPFLDNPYDYRVQNANTGFEVEDFGESLVDMVKTLQWRTGKHF